MASRGKAKKTRQILILNGPNLNMLGRREKDIYGTRTLKDIEKSAIAHGKGLGFAVECRQSNHEGELVGWVQDARERVDGVIINGGALTHTSVALMDALLVLSCPIIEVHLSNIYRREPFRHHSYVSHVATGVICGLGAQGYLLALDALAAQWQ